jgi:alkylation response protein AidB-like acyl-CoA dehydrogenase
MGRALIPSTFLSHTLAGLIIQGYGTESQKAVLLPTVVQGEEVFAIAITEPRETLDMAGIQCRAREEVGGYTLSGVKHFVRGGGAADFVVVLARMEGKLGLFVVDKRAEGVNAVALENIGDDDQARIELARVRVPREAVLGGKPQKWDSLQRIVDMGALMECGYGVGVMARDTELTIEYVKNRVQFGRPIGSFQAVQHQVADQATDLECGRFLTLCAAWAMDEKLPAASIEVARAKAWVSDALRRVVRTGQQLHGGIGFAREYDLHFYYRRAKTSELMFGVGDEHRERIAAALLDV